MNYYLKTIIMRTCYSILFALLISSIFCSPKIFAQSSDDCLACHDNKDLTMEKNGKQISLYVDTKIYKTSIHASQDCIACHVGFDPANTPHAAKIKAVDCSACHDVADFSRSVHGIAMNKGKKGAPTCAGCHTAHAIQLASKLKKDINACLTCHNSGDVQQYRNSKHYILQSSKKNVPTCTACHGAAHEIQSSSNASALTARLNITGLCAKCHGLNSKTFKNSVHNAIFTNDKSKAPVCTDCHGAHSASATKFSGASKGCLNCHLNQNVFQKIKGKENLVAFVQQFKTSVHGQLRPDGSETATCVDCHSNHMVDGRTDENAPTSHKNVSVTCGKCHKKEAGEYVESNHGQALAKGIKGAPTCTDCHGEHSVMNISNKSNRLSKKNEAAVCLKCHLDNPQVRQLVGLSANFIKSYEMSAHALALNKGSEKAPTCSSCHGSHTMKKGSDPTSKVNKRNVASTCGSSECHNTISNEFKESIHGTALKSGKLDSPSCTDCHGQHQILKTDDTRSAVNAANVSLETCARCHSSVTMSEKYGLPTGRIMSYSDSYHGLAAKGGSKAAANCASCHGIHNIKPSTDSTSMIYKGNLAKTCGQCHPNANENFTKGRVHVNADQKENNALIYWITIIYLSLIIITIGGMLIHNILDFFKKAGNKLRERRSGHPHHVGHGLYVRMTVAERIQHLTLLTSFITLVLTGFMLKFPDAWWVIHIREFGGDFAFNARSLLHRIAACVMIAASLFHIYYLFFVPRGKQLLKDILPRMQDAWDVMNAFKYYLGISKDRPLFDRFSYIEKAEYWALIWGTIVMVATGFILWFNSDFMRWTSKLFVDAAETIHYYEAWLATLAIIVWHFYFVIFNPEVYPMNLAWIKGTITEAEMAEEHPLELQRLKGEAEDIEIDVSNGMGRNPY